MVNDLIKTEEEKLNNYKNSLEAILNSFIGSTSKTIQEVIKRKIEMLEEYIKAFEMNIVSLENKKGDKNKYIRELNNKISALKKRMGRTAN